MTEKPPRPPPRPDWPDLSSYAYTQDLTPEGWGWEFLRRNPAYRAAWRMRGLTACAPPSGMGIHILPHPAGASEAALWGLVSFRGSEPQCARG
jgi:hypothetical protein